METTDKTVETQQEYADAFNEFAKGESGDVVAEVSQDTEKANEPVEQADEQPQVDPLKALELERDHYRHAFDANRGRVSALQKKINEMESQMRQPAQVNPGSSGMTDEQWNDFQNEYPEMAAAMSARLAQQERQFNQRLEQEVNSRLESVVGEIAPLKQRAHEEYLNNQKLILESKHRDWKQVAASAEFNEWIGKQPEDMQARLSSEDASDASYLLDIYKALNGTASNSQTANRQSRLQSNVGVKSKGSGLKGAGIPDDYASAFDYFANQS